MDQGYELTDGDAYRDPRVHGKKGEKKSYSHKDSQHKERLARDYNLFIDGIYQTSTEAPSGHLAKSGNQCTRCADGVAGWDDGNHYEFKPE